MISLQKKYKQRPIRFIEIWQINGWTIKVYGISCRSEYPKKSNIIDTAKIIALKQLNTITVKSEVYELGFIIVHEAKDGLFVVVDYWTGENMLCNHAYLYNHTTQSVNYLTPTGLTACVWEIRVINFERNAWVKFILSNPNGPNVSGYLNTTLNEDI